MLNRIILIVAIVLIVVGVSVQAQIEPKEMDTLIVSADCEQATVDYGHSNGEWVLIALTTIGGSSTIAPDDVSEPVRAPFSGSQTFIFSPPLDDGTRVVVFGQVTLGVVSAGDSKSIVDDVKGLSGGDVSIAETEFIITVSCDGESEVTEARFGCNDGRLNQNACEPIAIYSVISDDGVGMDVWAIDPETSVGTPSVYISAEELTSTQATGTTSRCAVAISSDGRTGVYLLAGGEIEVIRGPDFEDKYFVFTFETYPSLPVVGTYFGLGLPSASAC